jgi:hypothetical protein
MIDFSSSFSEIMKVLGAKVRADGENELREVAERRLNAKPRDCLRHQEKLAVNDTDLPYRVQASLMRYDVVRCGGGGVEGVGGARLASSR